MTIDLPMNYLSQFSHLGEATDSGTNLEDSLNDDLEKSAKKDGGISARENTGKSAKDSSGKSANDDLHESATAASEEHVFTPEVKSSGSFFMP